MIVPRMDFMKQMVHQVTDLAQTEDEKNESAAISIQGKGSIGSK